ncbi:MAG: metal-sensing transcriptional repressor [Ruminococcus sp.]|nr:metal-sensing transcriptional repressor [Candidatus Apopatosoma intestinale]
MTTCCEKKKIRTEAEKKALLNRLSRIEGQVRGLKNMVENDAYCVDVMTQTTAVRAALQAFLGEMLSTHLETCVADELRAGHDDVIDELVSLLKKIN